MQSFYKKNVKKNGGGILPEARLWGEFLQSLLLVPKKRLLPSFLRPLFLAKAAEGIETTKLGFDSAFLNFLEHSHFIFPFLDELASALVNIEDIQTHDIYDEYGEHLAIIQTLYHSYLYLLEKYNFYDKLSKNGEMYTPIIQHYDWIEFFMEGFLSRSECKILEKIASFTPLYIHTSVDNYNQEHIQATMGIPLEVGYRLLIHFNEKKIISRQPLKRDIQIDAYELKDAMDEVALSIELIHQWVEDGVSPDDIIIVLPDESFAQYLKIFDTYRNFNYAFGEKISTTFAYQFLDEICQYIYSLNTDYLPYTEYSLLQKESLQKVIEDSSVLFSKKGLGSLESFIYILQKEKSLYKVVEYLEEFYLYTNELKELFLNIPFVEILKFVLLYLQDKRIDDTQGGRIRVMGILETRGVEFDSVIVLNFNEGLVPKPQEKDIFLNSLLRKKVNLPTRKDRENLQKHYYLSLFSLANKSVVCFVHDEKKSVSHMVLEQQLKNEISIKIHPMQNYKNRLLGQAREHQHIIPTIEDSLSRIIREQNFIFSYTSLNDFVKCKRKFYYAHVQKLKTKEEVIIGSIIHHFLEQAYTHYQTPDERRAFFYHQIQQAKGDYSEVEYFNLELAGQYLKVFFETEKQDYQKGYRTLFCEYPFQYNLEGICFHGKIDRIDKATDGSIILIDYKLKQNFKIATQDLQFTLYKIAAQQLKETEDSKISAFYYDLYHGKKVSEDEKNIQGSYELLQTTLKELQQDLICFDLTEEKKDCLYCPYATLCDRD
ncbi:PD-(D/E)XK nuclease family protein [Helicobacter monodelphidis]|uniref:PD-(D/E)XK nuclease family protein n=1 Tax=Helicobacter sp. 15-1451 TaxID=2004995 RepID=UPI0015ECC6B1|nr:PD-(D/E)XK nuclease family protein [Helicobacter sp. 15-1451]